MPRTKSQVSGGTTKTKAPEEEPFPDWAEEEIKSVKLGEPELVTRSGYFLDIYENDYKVDIQVYEALPDGRTIVEGLDVPKSMKIIDFLKGTVYEFKINVSKGSLSPQLTELLKSKYNLDMDSIYRFEIVIPFFMRGAIWLKHTIPYITNPIIGKAFSRMMDLDNDTDHEN
jgi:hypothetical protein